MREALGFAALSTSLSRNTFLKSLFSLGDGGDVVSKRCGPPHQSGDASLALLLLVVLLALVDVRLASGEHEVDQAGELVCHGCVGSGLVHAGAQAPVEGSQR